MIDPKTVVGFAGMVSFTVAANLMLKVGASVPQAERILFGMLGWKSAAGLALFGCSGLLYAFLLRSVPLNLAQVFTASQYVGVIIAAFLILGEPISPARWLGIACICVGTLLVGATTYS
jgi:drug/metabolite transporter (DMT)-like permease